LTVGRVGTAQFLRICGILMGAPLEEWTHAFSWNFMADSGTTSEPLASAAMSAAAPRATDSNSPPPANQSASPRRYTYRGQGTGLFQKCAWVAGILASRTIAMLLFRLHVSGQGMIPKKGGVLLVTNHQSFLDPWLAGLAPPRQVHSMARDTLFKGGLLQWLMELLNAFPVKRGTADLGAIRGAVERLEKGYVVNIFAEGTRSEDGSIGPIAPGVALILHRTKTEVPIVPVIIDGAFAAWPRKARFPRPRPVRIVFGRPIPPAEWRALPPQELGGRIRRELVALQEQVKSMHAAESRRRLAEEEAKAATMPAKGRRRGRTLGGKGRGESEGSP
jgi:1-acyl-sn-glycerol-3-phosphate acyltransferase